MCTMTLADMGADVVKVERPDSGDDTRSWGPPWTQHNSSYFESVNRNKRSVTLDLKDPADREYALELVSEADVVVENMLTGVMDKLGLGYDDVAARNPRIVYCSITGFGSREGAHMPGYDFLVQAVGGLMSVTGETDGDPMKVGVALVDVLTGKDATIGILGALRERDRSGLGQRIEVSLLMSLLGSLVNQSSAYFTCGQVPRRMGNSHPSIAPYQSLQCQDGQIAIACGNDGQFQRLAQVIGKPELAMDERFSTNPARVANRDALTHELEAALAFDRAAVWVERITDVRVPVGEIGDIASGVQLAERLGLEPTWSVGDEHPRQVRHPITYSRSTLPTPVPPPDLGPGRLNEQEK